MTMGVLEKKSHFKKTKKQKIAEQVQVLIDVFGGSIIDDGE